MTPARSGALLAVAVLTGIPSLLFATACASPAPAHDTAPTIDFHQTGGPTPGLPGHGTTGSAPTAAATTTMSTAVAATPNTVDIQNFVFSPAKLTVPVGTTVTWINKDEEPHTVAANNAGFRSPGMGHDATFTFVFTTPGTFDYICTIHPFMHGTVEVTK
ncbi:cupredoxin family copper-binding protein [Nocardia sp. NPDC005998]|uniref:cupredoxin domain-containing protein n=1 Tax=Nocardia sp. NPDC005998 TaxID=3156894 RepID=UPI0033BD6149